MYATKKFIRRQGKKHRMTTRLYAKESGREEAMMGHIYRQGPQSELYLSLETFRDSKHLTSVMYDIAKGTFLRVVWCFLSIDLVHSP